MAAPLDGRADPLPEVAPLEKEEKLRAIAGAFGAAWLEEGEGNPVQTLWRRSDFLSTTELLLLGDAIQKLEPRNAGFVVDQVKRVKSENENERTGGFFELLGLAMFEGGSQRVEATRRNYPGVDGQIFVGETPRLNLSLKSHARSSFENAVIRYGEKLKLGLIDQLRAAGKTGFGVRAVGKNYPAKDAEWKELVTAVAETTLSAVSTDALVTQSTGNWAVIVNRLSDNFLPLSSNNISFQVNLFVPHHKHEAKRLTDNIEKACINLRNARQKEANLRDVESSILLRLPASAPFAKCEQWTRDYLGQHRKADMPASVFLYQPVVVHDTQAQTNFLAHVVSTILSKPTPPIAASVYIGRILSAQPSQIAFNDVGGSFNFDSYYAYQCGDIFTSRYAEAHLSSPAPGIFVHAELKALGNGLVFSGKFPPTFDLLIYP